VWKSGSVGTVNGPIEVRVGSAGANTLRKFSAFNCIRVLMLIRPSCARRHSISSDDIGGLEAERGRVVEPLECKLEMDISESERAIENSFRGVRLPEDGTRRRPLAGDADLEEAREVVMRARCCCKAATSLAPKWSRPGLSMLLLGVPHGVERREDMAEAAREALREALLSAVRNMGPSGMVRCGFHDLRPLDSERSLLGVCSRSDRSQLPDSLPRSHLRGVLHSESELSTLEPRKLQP